MPGSERDTSGTERVMLDLETVGTEPGAAILSIGAVRFDADGLGDEFYQSVSLTSCQEAGLRIDADTLEWWLEQDDGVQEVLNRGHDLSLVLQAFTKFYGDAEEIWAYSPKFDCAMLESAYDAVDSAAPWGYKDERDCRTLVSLPVSVDLEQAGDEHHALDDATYQARVASATLGRLQGVEDAE